MFLVIELFNLKDPMQLLQKNLFPVQIGLLLANAYKIYRIYGDSTLSDYSIGNTVNVLYSSQICIAEKIR